MVEPRQFLIKLSLIFVWLVGMGWNFNREKRHLEIRNDSYLGTQSLRKLGSPPTWMFETKIYTYSTLYIHARAHTCMYLVAYIYLIGYLIA